MTIKETIKLIAYLYYVNDHSELNGYINELTMNEVYELYTAYKIGKTIEAGFNNGKVVKRFDRSKYFLKQREFYKHSKSEKEIRNELKSKIGNYVDYFHVFVDYY
ncbi:hypothetical protein V5G65_15225 [Mammaliicoccus sciuri]|uniref:hypothetical protein n=1 Tax=Mammaliicoccus sciuri TaxID=1296 RepID=UPI0037A4E68A